MQSEDEEFNRALSGYLGETRTPSESAAMKPRQGVPKQSERLAYDFGRAAARAGQKLAHCPYSQSTEPDAYHAWRDGFRSTQ